MMCEHYSWWRMIALSGSQRAAVAVAGTLMLLTGCPETSPTNTNDNSSVNDNSSGELEQAAALPEAVTSVNVAITPEGAGQVVQTDLGFSRIQLFAMPASPDFVFDGWNGLPTSQNPVIIRATPDSFITAEFRSTLPPSEQAAEEDESADSDPDPVDQPEEPETEEPEEETPEEDTPEEEEPEAEEPVDEPEQEEDPEEEEEQEEDPQPSLSSWQSDDVFQYDYDPLAVTEVTYHFDPNGGLIETSVVFDADLLAELFFTDPENVTILTDTVPLGVPTDLVTINDPMQGVQTISFTYTTFALEIGTADDVTLSFDWEWGVSLESEEFVLLHVGTMTGTLSADETTITWEAIAGTVTTLLCAPGSGVPCKEFPMPADDFYAGIPLGSWTNVTGS